MKNNNEFFSVDTKSNIKIKHFIIAFAVFIILLSAFSIILFMYSLDFDLNNLVETTTELTETTTQENIPIYVVDNLSGSSNVMFIITDNNGDVESVFCTLLDFDNKSFRVKQVDGDAQYLYGEKYKSINGIYFDHSQDGLAEFFSNKWEINTDKYAVFTLQNLRKFLSLYGGLTINVAEDVNYKSADFSLELKKGKQEISGEKALNYLMICDDEKKEQVICDIIISILSAENFERSENLFKNFANLSKTNISVIDFFDAQKNIETYCYAKDKFLPKPFTEDK